MSIEKPSSSEEEYFAQQEAFKRKQFAEAQKKKISASEQEQLKSQHWMHCPKCGLQLETIEYRKVNIDKCFHCGGIYLDDGELEKILTFKENFLKGIANLFKG